MSAAARLQEGHWYPRELCPFCFGECEWEEASGKGKIYTLSVMERANPPYAMAYVAAGRGAEDADQYRRLRPRSVKIGQDVKLKFVPTEGGPPMPMFTPA